MGAERKVEAGNPFRRHAKLEQNTLIRLAFAFCCGTPLIKAAATASVSTKTTRAIYLGLRDRLPDRKFNRWHAAHQRLPAVTSPELEFVARVAFIEALAECYANPTCGRNFRLGNRKTRLCRACTLPLRFTRAESVEEALGVLDSVHAFYEHLGIRGEKAIDPLILFRLRFIHTTTIGTALSASRAPDGRLLPPQKPVFLSIWTLLDTLLLDLAERPL